MQKFKDLFSGHSQDYSKFRPSYPSELFEFLAKQVNDHQAAWDCGTGNGQGAKDLSQYFKTIYATDASENQIAHAVQKPNIHYSIAPAEQSKLASDSVSLITVFQALHWFDLEKFFAEAKRVIKPNGVLAIIGYNTAITGIDAVDQTYQAFCFDYLWQKHCWAMKRDSLNNDYQNIDFPFTEIPAPQLYVKMRWCFEDYLAYLNTWSAVKTHIQKYDQNPVESFVIPKIEKAWPDKTKARDIQFPLILRLGRL